MRIIRRTTGGIYVIGPRFIKHLQNSDEVDNNVKLWGGVIRLTSETAFKQVTDGCGIPYTSIPAGNGEAWWAA